MSDILIAEIGAGKRWAQANFDIATIKGFFEIDPQPGLDQEIILSHVRPDGSLRNENPHPFVAVPSQNFRFELGAAADTRYPTGADRPIGVFWKKGNGKFWYRLLMPDDAHYETVSTYLVANYNGPARQLRRITVDKKTMQNIWPDSPFWI